MARSLLQSLVVAGLELGEKVVFVEREMLGKSYSHNAFLRIDLAVGGGGAIPSKLSE